jgi:hypothetical protein
VSITATSGDVISAFHPAGLTYCPIPAMGSTSGWPHLHPGKGHGPCRAFLPFQARAAGQRTDVIQHGVDPGARARDRPVDPFARHKQRAPDPLRQAKRKQRTPQRGRIGKAGELIQRGNRQHAA